MLNIKKTILISILKTAKAIKYLLNYSNSLKVSLVNVYNYLKYLKIIIYNKIIGNS